MPFAGLVANEGDDNLIGSTSSLPTAALSSTLSNYLSILMHNHPGTTLEDANTIMQERYLREETFKYKDPADGLVKNGGKWYFIDSDKFIEEEILHKAEVLALLNNAPGSQSIIELSGFPGACYEGPGIYFSVDGTTYEMTGANRGTLESAVRSGSAVSWTYSADRARKYGVSGGKTITVHVMDKQARLIPDVSMTVQVK